MTKHFGGGGGRRLEPKEYPPRRGEIDKRPSVFDRLGVRKYEDNAPSSHSHYGSGDSGTGYRRNDGPPGPMRKHSPMPPGQMMGGRRNQDPRGDRIRSRSRSRSFSPRTRKVPSEIPHHHPHMGGSGGGGGGHGQMKKSKLKEIPPHDHRMRQRSSSPLRRKPGDKPVGVGSPKPWRDENPPRHNKGIPGGAGGNKSKKSSGKKSGGKKGGKDKERKAGKGRSSSGSSGSSGETSSSSRSASSSSSTSEASSSTSSNASSSTDSSVPSIKLRHDTKKKPKKVKPRPSSRSESVSTGQIQSRVSSGSSIESGNVRDNRDLREKIKAKTRQNYEGGIQQHGTPDLRHQRRPPQEPFPNRSYNKPDLREGSPGSARRRRPSGASSFSEKPIKRRRVLSPEEFVPSPRRAPPLPNDPPAPTHAVRRSPLPRDRIRVINSPMRRAPAEDTRRVDVRDINKRLDNYGDNKSRDIDRYRDDGGGGPFGRDSNRQKERLAPARPPPPGRQHPGHQMTSDRDRDNRGMNDRPGNNRFEPRHSRPLLQLPPGAEPQKIPYRGAPEDRVPRITIQAQSPALTKSGPMIVKSKEALIEKYRVMKQSQYVDMWVDKTVEACAPPGSSIVSPPKDTPSVSSRTFDDSAETGTKVSSIKDIEDLLSDFSDDADELLNDVGDERKSDKSERENIEKKVPDCETEVASAATVSHSTETNTPIEKEKKPVQSAPPVVTSGVIAQDRKSVGTPQRTSSSFIEPRGEGQSLPSHSQTEDDILERMDFEEISDEELGDVGENKIPIVDALGVDWASLVCGEKNRPISPSSVPSTASTAMKVRKRWTPLQVVSRVGLLSNCSEKLLQKVVELKMKEEPYSESTEDPMDLEEKIQDELQNAGKFRKRRARGNVIDTIGLGPNSRALSSRRDMALRRYYLGMPQKSLVSMDMLHQNPASNSVQDLESIGELYRLSLSLFKGSETATVAV